MKSLLHLPIWLLLIAYWTGNAAVNAADTSCGNIVLISYEEEYHSAETLSRFAQLLHEGYGCHCTMLQGEKKMGIAGLEKLASADVLVLYVRRHALPKEQMAIIRRYLEAGKPLVALRTSSHAFDIRTEPPTGMDVWPNFDHEVLGGNYHGYHKSGNCTEITATDNAIAHPIIAGIQFGNWTSNVVLYKVTPLTTGTFVLLNGRRGENSEPIAWTNKYHGGRVFYSSLGDPQDFQTQQFRTMLVNTIYWAMNKPVPKGLKQFDDSSNNR